MQQHSVIKKLNIIWLTLLLALVFAMPIQAVTKNQKPVKTLPFIFTPGTHGTLLIRERPISGNVELAADHLHEDNYVLNGFNIPDVRADADWLFRGWQVYLVEETSGQFNHLAKESKTDSSHLTSSSSSFGNRLQEDKKDNGAGAALATGSEAVESIEDENGELEELIGEVEIITRQNMNEALAKYLDTPNAEIVYSSDVLQFLKLPYRKGFVYRASPYYQYIPKTPQSLLIRHQLNAQVHTDLKVSIPATGEKEKRVPTQSLLVMALFSGALYFIGYRLGGEVVGKQIPKLQKEEISKNQ